MPTGLKVRGTLVALCRKNVAGRLLAPRKVFTATEAENSSGVYRAHDGPLLATTHAAPPPILAARARPADASSTAIDVTFALETPAEVHYAVFASPDGSTVTAGRGPGPEDGGSSVSQRAAHGRDPADAMILNGLRGCDYTMASLGRASPVNVTDGPIRRGVVSSREEPRSHAEPVSAAVFEADGPATGHELVVNGSGAMVPAPATPLADGTVAKMLREVAIRIEGLDEATAHDICLFTETPSSRG